MDLLVRKSIVRVKREGYIHNTRTASGLMLELVVRKLSQEVRHNHPKTVFNLAIASLPAVVGGS